MKRRLNLFAAVLGLSVASCAASPDSIAPAYISELRYDDLSCGQLASERARVANAYTRVEAQQIQARNNDVVGVILIGLPVSSLSGQNVASQVADIKGQLDTIDRLMIRKDCAPSIPQQASETPIPRTQARRPPVNSLPSPTADGPPQAIN